MGRKEKVVSQKNTIGARMRLARSGKGIALSEMAKLIGYTKSRLSTVENGNGRPSVELVQAYEQVLELQPGELMQEQENNETVLGRRYSSFSETTFSQELLVETLAVVEQEQQTKPAIPRPQNTTFVRPVRVQIGDAPGAGNFYGRERELALLEQWIEGERSSVVTILGIGGVGKTMLASVLKERMKERFDYVYWSRVQNAPPLEELLRECLLFLSGQDEVELPEDREEQIALFVEYFRHYRCLLVLDNIETILEAGQSTGNYRQGYEGYRVLIEQIGRSSHQSCLLLTSREMPQPLENLEGRGAHTLHLEGIGLQEGRMILREKGLTGSDEEYRELISAYAGNPLALMLVAAPIREIFGGEIAEFLTERGTVVGDIYTLIDTQFHRLSAQEQEIIYWLALACEPLSLNDILKEKIVRPVSKRILLEALDSLRRRSMVENSGGSSFTLQPVIMEYVTDRFVRGVCKEIEVERFTLLASHALIRAEAKDHIRNNQMRLFLTPIVGYLLSDLGKIESEAKLKNILATLRMTRPQTPEYAAGNLLNLLVELKVDMRGYDFSNLVVWHAYLQDVALQDVNFAHARLEHCVFTDTFGSILSVALNGNGDLLAAGTANGEVRFWNAHSGAPLGICQGHTDWVRSVAVSPDNTMVISGSDDQVIRVWDVKTTQCLNTLYGHTNRVRSVAFGPDGETAVSGGDDHTVRFWNVGSGECLNTLTGHTSRVWSVAFSPTGKLVASGSSDQTVKLWDVESGQCLKSLYGHKDRIWSVAFSPDGSRVVSGCDDLAIRVWDVESGECISTLKGHTSRIWSVTFSPDGEHIASGSDDQTIRIWSVSSGECLMTLRGHTNRVWSVAFSADGASLVSGSDDQTIRMWSAREGQCFKTIQGHSSRVRAVTFASDGQLLISGSDDRVVRIWDFANGQCLKALPGHSTWIYTVACSKDNIIASGSDDQTIRLWDIDTGYCLRTLGGHTNWVRSVAFSPDGELLVSGSDDQTVRIWQVNTGLCLGVLQSDHSRIWSVAFSNVGNLVASGGEDQVVRIWQADTGECLQELKGHANRVRTVTFSTDGKILASCSDDRTIRLWEVSTGRCLKIFKGHLNWVWSVAFSPDGTMLVSGGDDQSVRLWKLESDQPLWVGYEHSKRIYSVAFGQDGQVASGSYDGTIKLWDVESGKCIQTLRKERPYERMNITSVEGMSPAQKAMLRNLGAIEL